MAHHAGIMLPRSPRSTWIGVGTCLIGVTLNVAAGCKQETRGPDLPTGYSLARENPQWDSVAWINDQPARRFEGGGGGLWDVTQFVVQGENTIRIEASWNSRPPFGSQAHTPCNLKLVSVMLGDQGPCFTELKNLTEESNTSDDVIRKQYTFSATVPLHWIWQDADELGELSAPDKSQILAL